MNPPATTSSELAAYRDFLERLVDALTARHTSADSALAGMAQALLDSFSSSDEPADDEHHARWYLADHMDELEET